MTHGTGMWFYLFKSSMAGFKLFRMVRVVGVTNQNFKIGSLKDFTDSIRKNGKNKPTPEWFVRQVFSGLGVLCIEKCFGSSVSVIESAVSEI